MAYIETDSIQLGWSVWDSEGKELGKVIGVEADAIRVKKEGLLGGEMMVPKDAVTDVETGRVEVGLTKHEVEAGSR